MSMLAVDKKVTGWTPLAENAYFSLGKGSIRSRKIDSGKPISRKGMPIVRLNQGVVQDISEKLLNGPHFAVIRNPRSVVREAFPQARFSPQELKQAVRSLEYYFAVDVQSYIEASNPQVFGSTFHPSMYVPESKIVTPDNPISPHVEFFCMKTLTLLGCLDQTPEEYAKFRLWNLNEGDNGRNYFDFFLDKHERRTTFIDKALLDSGEVEFHELQDLSVDEGYIVVFLDWLLAHSTGPQEERRIIDSIEMRREFYSVLKKDGIVNAREQKRKFILSDL